MQQKHISGTSKQAQKPAPVQHDSLCPDTDIERRRRLSSQGQSTAYCMHAGFATSNHGSSLTHTPVRVSYLSSAVVRRCNYHVPLFSCSAKETVKGPAQIASGCHTIPDHSCFNLGPVFSCILGTPVIYVLKTKVCG